ncbi:MAG TPA: hypothetical protein VIV60_21390 [Polyangiaceae bacterium]
MAGRVSQFLSALRTGLVSDVPPEYQACESCREATCNSAKAENCLDRRYGEQQERSRRFEDNSRSGTHAIGEDRERYYDVPSTRLVPPASEVRSTRAGEYHQAGGEEVVNLPTRRQSNQG